MYELNVFKNFWKTPTFYRNCGVLNSTFENIMTFSKKAAKFKIIQEIMILVIKININMNIQSHDIF